MVTFKVQEACMKYYCNTFSFSIHRMTTLSMAGAYARTVAGLLGAAAVAVRGAFGECYCAVPQDWKSRSLSERLIQVIHFCFGYPSVPKS